MSAVAKMIGGLLLAVILAGAASLTIARAKAPSAPAELAITVNENFVFLPLRLHCKAGMPVRFRITHRTPSNGPDIAHSLVLLNRGTNTDDYGQAVLNARPEDDYVPA